MEFSTKVLLQRPPFSICHLDRLLMLGSCFTENIGGMLHSYGFELDCNPFGIVYNPISIFKSIQRIVSEDYYSSKDLLYYNDLYLSLDHHGSFSGLDKAQVLEKINNRLSIAHQQLKESKYILITLGTSFVYRHIERDSIVANCHKIPGSEFDKRILSTDDILLAYKEIHPLLENKIVIFTVSPVRHWREGAVENSRSKSILLESIHQLKEMYGNITYFPAYEIMMDELRDYRFYAEDMLHPNNVAIQYIWERFIDSYMSSSTLNCMDRIDKLKMLYQHKIKHPGTQSAFAYQTKVEDALSNFKRDYPDIDIQFSSLNNTGNSI